MAEIAEGPYSRGQNVWVVQPDGSRRAAEYVGQAETSAWFGGAPLAIVVYPDDASGAQVEIDRVIPRD